jgi:dTDP-4-dehydrorhamnose reductase
MKWLITGASGLLGSHAFAQLNDAGEAVVGWTHSNPRPGCDSVDITDASAVASAVATGGFDVCIHTAADPDIDSCEKDPTAAHTTNVKGAQHVFDACIANGVRFVHVSTDYVFDGTSDRPYVETDERNPLQVYGKTKADAEDVVDGALIARIPVLYGRRTASSKTTWLEGAVAKLRAGEPITANATHIRQPAWAADIATALIQLGRSSETGIVHVAPDAMTRFEWTRVLASVLGADAALVEPTSDEPAIKRPHRAELNTDKLRSLGLSPPRSAADALPHAVEALA